MALETLLNVRIYVIKITESGRVWIREPRLPEGLPPGDAGRVVILFLDDHAGFQDYSKLSAAALSPSPGDSLRGSGTPPDPQAESTGTGTKRAHQFCQQPLPGPQNQDIFQGSRHAVIREMQAKMRNLAELSGDQDVLAKCLALEKRVAAEAKPEVAIIGVRTCKTEVLWVFLQSVMQGLESCKLCRHRG